MVNKCLSETLVDIVVADAVVAVLFVVNIVVLALLVVADHIIFIYGP